MIVHFNSPGKQKFLSAVLVVHFREEIADCRKFRVLYFSFLAKTFSKFGLSCIEDTKNDDKKSVLEKRHAGGLVIETMVEQIRTKTSDRFDSKYKKNNTDSMKARVNFSEQ